MRIQFSDEPVKFKECKVTIIHHGARGVNGSESEGSLSTWCIPSRPRASPSHSVELGNAGVRGNLRGPASHHLAPTNSVDDNQHADGPASNPSAVLSSTDPNSFLHGPSAPSILRRLWMKSPYCPESPKHGTVVRENGRWVRTEKGRGD
jgi:hypothetical protein